MITQAKEAPYDILERARRGLFHKLVGYDTKYHIDSMEALEDSADDCESEDVERNFGMM
jgi:hypothetical protein